MLAVSRLIVVFMHILFYNSYYCLLVYLPDALASECARCTDTQKKIAGKVLAQLLQFHRKEFFDPLVVKYDPDGNFRKKYEEKDVEYEEYEDED